MPEKVLEFYLTHHFMLQGWDRSIDKTVLHKILPYVEVSQSEKKLVVVTPAFYTSKGITGRPKHCLVLVLKHKLIKTGFWCDFPNYVFKKDSEAEFQLLYY